MADGRLLEHREDSLWQVAPPDPDWHDITTQQLFFVLYALQQCKKNIPINLTQKAEQPLRVLFDSLADYMQEYVARACAIKIKSNKHEQDKKA